MQNKTLERIARHLIIYSAAIENIGLMNGKMGIALFFYQLHQVTKSENHQSFANHLIQEISSKIDYQISRTFFNGLIGIAWGFDYLIKHNFVDFEDEDMLTELDQALLEINIERLFDESFSTGIRGVAYYIVSRCSGTATIPAPFDKEYIQVLVDRINRIESRDPTAIYLLNRLHQLLNGYIIDYDMNIFYQLIGNEPFDETNLFIPKRNIGIIDNGYTGIAFRLLNNIESDAKNHRN